MLFSIKYCYLWYSQYICILIPCPKWQQPRPHDNLSLFICPVCLECHSSFWSMTWRVLVCSSSFLVVCYRFSAQLSKIQHYDFSYAAVWLVVLMKTTKKKGEVKILPHVFDNHRCFLKQYSIQTSYQERWACDSSFTKHLFGLSANSTNNKTHLSNLLMKQKYCFYLVVKGWFCPSFLFVQPQWETSPSAISMIKT